MRNLYLPLSHTHNILLFSGFIPNSPTQLKNPRNIFILLHRLSVFARLHTSATSADNLLGPADVSIDLLSESPLHPAAGSAPLFVSLPVGVNNLTTELLQRWLPSRPQIGTVCLFMTLCGGAHVWDVQEREED